MAVCGIALLLAKHNGAAFEQADEISRRIYKAWTIDDRSSGMNRFINFVLQKQIELLKPVVDAVLDEIKQKSLTRRPEIVECMALLNSSLEV